MSFTVISISVVSIYFVSIYVATKHDVRWAHSVFTLIRFRTDLVSIIVVSIYFVSNHGYSIKFRLVMILVGILSRLRYKLRYFATKDRKFTTPVDQTEVELRAFDVSYYVYVKTIRYVCHRHINAFCTSCHVFAFVYN